MTEITPRSVTMTSNEYGMILTDTGLAQVANAHILGQRLKITHFAVGDGGGAKYTPTQEMTALRNEKWRGITQSVEGDANNPNRIVTTCTIPMAAGGFYIREIGLFDENGLLIAVGNVPESYKPRVEEGSATDLTLRTVFVVTNTSAIQLQVDPTVMLASKDYVEKQVIPLLKTIDEATADFKGQLIKPLNIETFDGSNEAYHPSYIEFNGTWNGYKYWLAYTPLPYGRTPYVDRWECPCLAASNDGKTWVLPFAETPNPLVDLTEGQIAKRDYFSDTRIVMNGSTMEIWYRHTNGDNTSNTNIYRVTTTDGKTLTSPEMVQDSQNASVQVSPISTSNFFRSQSVLIENEQYVTYTCTNQGMYRVVSTNPSTKTWTDLTKVNVTGGSTVAPWHASVDKLDSVYHLVGYYNSGGPQRIEYYKSTDGINFTFVKTLVSLADKKYSNLRGLYQACVGKRNGQYVVIVSVNLDAQPNIEKRGLAMMIGDTVETATFVDVPGAAKHRESLTGGLVLQNSDKPNASANPLILNVDEQGDMQHGLGLRTQLGNLTPTYYSPRGVQNVTTTYIAGQAPRELDNVAQIGNIHLDQTDPNAFYLKTADGNWLYYTSDAFIKNSRKNVDLADTIVIDKKTYRVVINTKTNGLVDLNKITGATDGQEILIISALAQIGDVVTLKHNIATDGGRFRLRGEVDKILGRYDTLKLHYLNGSWYEI